MSVLTVLYMKFRSRGLTQSTSEKALFFTVHSAQNGGQFSPPEFLLNIFIVLRYTVHYDKNPC